MQQKIYKCDYATESMNKPFIIKLLNLVIIYIDLSINFNLTVPLSDWTDIKKNPVTLRLLFSQRSHRFQEKCRKM